MRRFAELLDRLVYTPSRNGKLRLLTEYLSSTPDPDRGWALAVLTDGLGGSRPVRRLLASLLEGRVDPVLVALSRDYVGDTAETVALLWPEPERTGIAPNLTDVAMALARAETSELERSLAGWLDGLDATGRWALLKMLTGALRVGVSARLAKVALAELGGRNVTDIEEVWHCLEAPYGALFDWLEGRGARPDVTDAPVFRPLMLAHPIEERELASLDPAHYLIEWKWDGIRVQLVSRGGTTRLYSRSGDEIGRSFPDVVARCRGEVVLDGELLVVRDGVVAPFNDLQQRLNRKTVTARLIARYPAHLRLYDMLIEGEEDLRGRALSERRERLESWFERHATPGIDLSEVVGAPTLDALMSLWKGSRAAGIEGLMLKRRGGAYLAGRPKGEWYKLKRAPLTADVVLMYAQRGSGKRSSFYSDFTFGAWRQGANGEPELVPVGKAYSGYTDDELARLDKWVREHTLERFGPVRSVAPGLVLEVAFDAVHRSPRHKSGIAMRFPRIHRLRWEKPASEADRIEMLEALIEAETGTTAQAGETGARRGRTRAKPSKPNGPATE
ncbi:MAG: cisplatin damage response ATP-dependent DNA ligase [Rhizobiales bacterium]|nr:cisplatin damage response ATP-dependent DNA ligase [Hyphomicrobiales bacterium]